MKSNVITMLIVILAFSSLLTGCKTINPDKDKLSSGKITSPGDTSNSKELWLNPELYFIQKSAIKGIPAEDIKKEEIEKMKATYKRENPAQEGVTTNELLAGFAYFTTFATDEVLNSREYGIKLAYGLTARVFKNDSKIFFDEIIGASIMPEGDTNFTCSWNGTITSDINPSDRTKAVVIGSGNIYVNVDQNAPPSLIAELEKNGFQFSTLTSDKKKVYYKWHSINHDFQVGQGSK